MNELASISASAAIVFYVLGFAQLLIAQGRTTETLPSNRQMRVALLGMAAVACHAWSTFSALVTDAGIDLALVHVCNYIAVVMVAVVALANSRLPVISVNLLLFPIAVINCLALLIIAPGNSTQLTIDSSQATHILLSLTAYAGLMTAALQSILLAFQEKQLQRLDTGFYRMLPALETMERLLIAMLWIGTVLLSGNFYWPFIPRRYVRPTGCSPHRADNLVMAYLCLLYTSDAADD